MENDETTLDCDQSVDDEDDEEEETELSERISQLRERVAILEYQRGLR